MVLRGMWGIVRQSDLNFCGMGLVCDLQGVIWVQRRELGVWVSWWLAWREESLVSRSQTGS